MFGFSPNLRLVGIDIMEVCMTNTLMKTMVFCIVILLIFSNPLWANGESEAFGDWEELETLLNSDEKPLLIDVRTLSEYKEGHIPGAMLIPHTEITDKPPAVGKDNLIILYCRSGSRSGQALRSLESLGYTNVVDFGGIGQWKGELHYGVAP